ncbi:NirD/YgiW/YdeI family stress tolerance protein [Rickettsiales endosymbiont of Peranema trichophorum]|uniref:YgiW/YdeI family stress tolerance OB fold protein n=1 Tax=Rickettsiales endosymbiont of Peranema trichophorum TaxID=2486577 RepID=UPI0010230200|nr:NirD/YgiW/YdeI family stress tolerance protein [Rickettsiales endosymbiont of Peranema trichophorum]RZI47619.1 NirD/YgiW/YdeI family stress tolerance protein [Rickettsiales endosymbiont of Peranema trichophorum]
MINKFRGMMAVAMLLSFAVSAEAANGGFVGPNSAGTQHGGFVGPDASSASSIKSVLENGYDDMRVVLQGYITKRLSHDRYMFSDGAKEIVVEIDDEDMPREQITPKTLLKICGEVDLDRGYLNPLSPKIEIDVKHIEIVK